MKNPWVCTFNSWSYVGSLLVTGGNTISRELIGLGFGIAFWMIILWLGGRGLTAIGIDLLKGKNILKIKS
jgi:hypothetical protein